MASGSNLNCSSSHCVILKRQRYSLVKELPDPAVLLEDGQLKQSFTEAERKDILRGETQAKRAAKFLDKLELKPASVFSRFTVVLEGVDQGLARKLTQVSPVAQVMQRPLENGWIPGAPVDPGDDCGVWAEDVGAANDLGRLDEGCKEFLGDRLNGNAADRATFHRFCQALRIEDRLVKVSLSAANPTGFIIKRLSDDPRASMSMLERALRDIGKHSIYIELLEKL